MKKDELRCIVIKTGNVINGITESKLDHTVPNSEVNLPGYILQCTRNGNEVCVTCCIRMDLCFNTAL